MKFIAIRCETDADLEAVRSAVLAFPPERVLVQVYDCISDSIAIQRVRERLIALFPRCPILGINSSSGILNGRTLDGAVIVSFSLFERAFVKTMLIPQNQDMERAGRDTAAALADPDLKAVIAFGCGLSDQVYLDNGVYLRTLAEELKGIPISGGLAGAEFGDRRFSYVFTENGFTSAGFAAASISGPGVRALVDFDVDWVPVGRKMTITGVTGKRVYTIDDKPVSDLYRDYLGVDSALVSVDLINRFPLMRNRHGEDLTDLVSRVYADGSVDFIHQLNIGEQVRFGICDARLQEDGVQRVNRALRAFSPDAVFYFACGSRKFILGETSDADLAAFAGISSSCGLYTFGEFFVGGARDALFFHQAMTILALAEGGAARARASTSSARTVPASIDGSDKYLLLRALINLVTSTAKELEEKNRQLTELAHYDGLTGLENRRSFDDHLDWAIKTHARSSTSFVLILLDVDFFKLFNDLYGHVGGDDCLRSLGLVLRDVLQRAGDHAFRYGGEEFACILSPANAADAVVVAERIRGRIEALGIPHRNSPDYGCVTVSLGALTVRADKRTTPNGVIASCDALLYEAKKNGRNRAVCREARRAK